jgi:phage terminase Nu1 subunit (DNA packaging protein)
MTIELPQGHGGRRAGAGRKPRSEPVTPDNQDHHELYTAARAKREQAMASLAELELQERERTLLPTDVVQQHWSYMVGSMRQILLTVPSRLAAVVPGCDTQQDIEREAMKLIREALSEISKPGVPTA